MAAFVFVGDDVAAAGWRLAGVAARVPAPGGEAEALAAAREGAELVLVSAEVAQAIPEAKLRAALRALSPVTLVVPDLRGAAPYPDVARRMKRQLGIEA
ncbi:MAG: hypothetical protein AB7P08_17505 [Burkholderiales bacterium]